VRRGPGTSLESAGMNENGAEKSRMVMNAHGPEMPWQTKDRDASGGTLETTWDESDGDVGVVVVVDDWRMDC